MSGSQIGGYLRIVNKFACNRTWSYAALVWSDKCQKTMFLVLE